MGGNLFKEQGSPVTGKHAGGLRFGAAHKRALERLFLAHEGFHGAVRADHVAHEAADAALLVLDDQPVRAPLQGFPDAGINTGRFLAVPAEPDIRAHRALEYPYVGDIFG